MKEEYSELSNDRQSIEQLAKTFYQNNKLTSILPSSTDNRSITEIDVTKVSNNMTRRTLPEYKDKYNKQHK